MMTLGWLIFIAGAVIGWAVHRAMVDGLMMAQEHTHKAQMDEIFAEVTRCRAQVADPIGKNDKRG
jgi:hypothetical protein